MDYVNIGDKIYPLSEEGLQNVFKLFENDYDIRDCSKDEICPSEGYYASLKSEVFQRKCKCDYCQHYNPTEGSFVHGFTCENCGKVIYLEYLPNSPVSFYFRRDVTMRHLRFIVHSYKNDTLFVYDSPQTTCGFYSIPVEKVPDHLRKFENDFERVEIEGQNLLAFYCPVFPSQKQFDRIKIEIYEIGSPPHKKIPDSTCLFGYRYEQSEENRKQRYTKVQIYKGQEYEEKPLSDTLPVKRSFSIALTFRHAPIRRDENLSRKILQASSQVADCSYYCQDGRVAFGEVAFNRMCVYVEYFTDLDLNLFNKFLRTARRDGPGFICDLAEHVEKQTGVPQYVENNPKISSAANDVLKSVGWQSLAQEPTSLEGRHDDQK